MPKRIDYQGAIHEFPDDFTDADIAAALSPQKPQAQAPQPRSWMDTAGDVVSGWWSKVNPLEQVKGAVTAASQPLQTLRGMGEAQDTVRLKAEDAFKRGDYAEGIRHALNFFIPVLGPEMDQAGDTLQAGQFAKGTGELAGMATNILLPAGVAKVKGGVRVTPRIANPNQAEAAAAQFLESKGVPVDAATTTGNDLVRNVQKLADSSPVGSFVAQKSKTATAEALRNTADDLANRVRSSPAVPEQAGAAVKQQLDIKVARLNRVANRAYADFHAAAENPANVKNVAVQYYSGKPIMADIAMPVDMRYIRDALKPIYDDMRMWMEPAKRHASAGFQALESILYQRGPMGQLAPGLDYLPATIAEQGLSGLKALAREAPSPAMRNVSQGLAARVIPQLQKAIDDAAAAAGPKALKGLQRGRALTATKHEVFEIAKQLRDEPVQVFNQLTWQKDAGIDLLREVQKQAPKEMAQVGRAYLEDLFSKATSQGGFDHANSLWQQWRNLGPETKKALFKNPLHIQDLDRFFLGVKKMAENPNPSGSGVIGWVATQGIWGLTHPATGIPWALTTGAISKMLHSPKGVRLLMEGLRIPLGHKAAAANVATQILDLAGEGARPLQPALAAANNPAAGEVDRRTGQPR